MITKKYFPAASGSAARLMRRCVWLLLCLGTCAAYAAAPQPKRILVISTFHLSHRWTAEFNQSLQDNLQAMRQKISLDFLELNAIQRRDIDFEAKFQPYLKHIQNGKYDLLVAVLGDAINLLESNYERLPPSLPIVCIADQPVPQQNRPRFPTMTGTCNDVNVMKNIDLGLKLMPDTRKVLIITDDVDSGIFLYKSLKSDMRTYRRCPVELINGKDYSTDRMLEKVSNLPRNSFVLFAPWRNFLKDGYFSLEQVAGELKKKSPGPYLIITDVLIGKGALGGYVSRGESHAQRAAKQISRLFAGEKPLDIPYILCPRELMIDMNVMRQFNLPERLLPPETELLNRKPPFWEEYRTECITIAVAFFFIMFLLLSLLFYHLYFRRMSRQSSFLLNHGGELAKVSYFYGDDDGKIIWLGGDPAIGIPNDGAAHQLADWIVPDEREKLQRLRDLMISEKLSLGNEVFHSKASGHRRSYRLLVAGKKHANSYLVVIQDITETQAAAEAKSYFLTSVSHEIRTPLNAIMGFSGLLRAPDISAGERSEYADAICTAGNRLLELINDVLDLSRLENGKMEFALKETDFPALAENILAVFRMPMKEKNLRMNITVFPMPSIFIDSHMIKQIVMNLFGHALQSTVTGHIDFSAEFQKTSDSEGELTITISDTGCGISAENQQKIFQPFAKIDAASSLEHDSGTGLELPLAQRLATAMNGDLTIKSTLDVGTTISVVLKNIRFNPVAPPSVPPQLAENALPPELLVLLVDDVALNLKILEAMLKKLNIRTFSATSAADALKIIEDHTVDTVLTDMWMPGMNGMELAAELRTKPWGKKLKIVAVTADADASTNFAMNDFDAIIHKPVTLEKLLSIIK